MKHPHLPQYFAIKRDENNPLWEEYINWVIQKSGDTFWRFEYVGFDGSEFDNGFNAAREPHNFTNPVTIITLSEWKQAIDKTEEMLSQDSAAREFLVGDPDSPDDACYADFTMVEIDKDNLIDLLNRFSDQFKPKWISVSERVPEVDESDEWKNKQRHSKTVPVIERGELNLGWYNHQLEDWQVNGRIGNIQVTEWFDLPLPTKP